MSRGIPPERKHEEASAVFDGLDDMVKTLEENGEDPVVLEALVSLYLDALEVYVYGTGEAGVRAVSLKFSLGSAEARRRSFFEWLEAYAQSRRLGPPVASQAAEEATIRRQEAAGTLLALELLETRSLKAVPWSTWLDALKGSTNALFKTT